MGGCFIPQTLIFISVSCLICKSLNSAVILSFRNFSDVLKENASTLKNWLHPQAEQYLTLVIKYYGRFLKASNVLFFSSKVASMSLTPLQSELYQNSWYRRVRRTVLCSGKGSVG